MWTYGFTSTFCRFGVDFGSILGAKSVKKSIEKTIEKTDLEKTTAEGLQERHLGSMTVIGRLDFGRRGGYPPIWRVNPSDAGSR